MNSFLAGLLSVLAATNQPLAVSNLVQQKTGLSISVSDPNDPLEQEYLKLLELDDAVQQEVDDLIAKEQKFRDVGAGVDDASLKARIQQKLEPVKNAYNDFLKRHPKHAKAMLAFGSFLNDVGEEMEAQAHWEKARELDPKNPAAWNNLANWYGHNSPVTKSFEYYAKAIELDPTESTYYHNLATTVFLFRRDATNYYKISEPEVFDKAMKLYDKALELDPNNFVLATDIAQSFYGFPLKKSGDPKADRAAEERRTEDALKSWERAMKIARDDVERQGVLLHFARVQINAGRLEQARTNLSMVTNAMFNTTKTNLLKKLERVSAQ